MKRLSLLLPALLLALASPAFASPAAAEPRLTRPLLREAMRKLWEDHVTYTAFFYTAAINGGDDAARLAARLLRNQDAIGDAVKPFYGAVRGVATEASLGAAVLAGARRGRGR